MGIVKIRMNTWNRCGNRDTKFKRNVAPREGFLDFCTKTNTVTIKNSGNKWKPWDTSIPRGKDEAYIQSRKELYSGLCFENKQQAQKFMEKHKEEIAAIAAANPLFDHWSIMNVIDRFKPTSKMVYGKDIIED